MMKIKLFFELYFLYRKKHGRRYSFDRAKQIAFDGLPF